MLHCYWPGITYCTVNNIITVYRVLGVLCPRSSQTCNVMRVPIFLEGFFCFFVIISCLIFCAFTYIYSKQDFATNKNITTCFLIFYDFRPPSSSLPPPPSPSVIFDNPVGRLKFSAQCLVNWPISPGQWWAIDHVKGEISITWIPASGGECLASPPPPPPPTELEECLVGWGQGRWELTGRNSGRPPRPLLDRTVDSLGRGMWRTAPTLLAN